MMKKQLMKPKTFAVLTLFWFLSIGAAAPVKMTPIKVTDGRLHVWSTPRARAIPRSSSPTRAWWYWIFISITPIRHWLDPKAHGQESQVSHYFTQRRRPCIRLLAFSRGQTGLDRHEESSAGLANARAREFNERKNSNDPRYAAYKKGELVQPDIGFDGNHDALLRRADLSNHRGRPRPQHRRSDGLYSPETRDAHGRSPRYRDPSGPRASRRDFFPTCRGWIRILDNIMARNYAVDTYIPGHGPRSYWTRRSRTLKNRSATSS